MSDTIDPRLIAFYLPQFHPCAENDAWWGRGFTEWTNVTRARPLFPGHVQPRLPADLGFYDLRLAEAREAQADMARRAGISAFCYYHYWFAGKRLLNRPLDEVIAARTPDFPFCVCWANESWTRRWDGLDEEVLIQQRYDGVEPEDFLRDLLPALRDPRYLRVNGRPLLLVYRPEAIPDIARWTERWRRFAAAEGLGDLYLCRVHAFSQDAPDTIGFDAAVEFPPLGGLLEKTLLDPAEVSALAGSGFAGLMADYRRFAALAAAAPAPSFRRFRGVMPSWDNTPRRGNRALLFRGATPDDYEAWLASALLNCMREQRGEERLVFINAWNEWAEGCHLEPDAHFGERFLNATRSAMSTARRLHAPALEHLREGDADAMLDLLQSRERSIQALAAELRARDETIADLKRLLAAADLAARSNRPAAAPQADTRPLAELTTAGQRPKAVIFGAGRGGERALRHLESAWEIVAFLDNDPQKHGTRLHGLPVLPAASLHELDSATVFVASMYGEEIRQQLAGLGVRRSRIQHVDAQVLASEQPAAADSMQRLKVIIFGTGMGGLRAYRKLPPECRIVAFADNDPAKIGLEYCGHPILSPEQLRSSSFDHILVASMHADEIVTQLEELGIPPCRIEVVHHSILVDADPSA